MTDLSVRNTLVIEQALAHLSEKVYAQQSQIDALRTTISNLLERVADAERMAAAVRIKAMGNGPTER